MFISLIVVVEYERRPDIHTNACVVRFYDDQHCAMMLVGRTVIFFGMSFFYYRQFDL